MKVLLFANGEIEDYSFCKQYCTPPFYVICCDGGVRHAKKLGLKPDIILGDLDSADPMIIKEYREQGVLIQTCPCEKDETDMELGLQHACQAGATETVIIGGIGSRLDHTLANCHLLYRCLKKGIDAKLVNERNCIYLIQKQLALYGQKGDTVSLLPFSMEVTGITLEGFYYPLANATLAIDSPRGISNVMLGETARVTIKTGLLYVMQCRDT